MPGAICSIGSGALRRDGAKSGDLHSRMLKSAVRRSIDFVSPGRPAAVAAAGRAPACRRSAVDESGGGSSDA